MKQVFMWKSPLLKTLSSFISEDITLTSIHHLQASINLSDHPININL